MKSVCFQRASSSSIATLFFSSYTAEHCFGNSWGNISEMFLKIFTISFSLFFSFKIPQLAFWWVNSCHWKPYKSATKAENGKRWKIASRRYLYMLLITFSGLSDKIREKSWTNKVTKTRIFFCVKWNKNFFKDYYREEILKLNNFAIIS